MGKCVVLHLRTTAHVVNCGNSRRGRSQAVTVDNFLASHLPAWLSYLHHITHLQYDILHLACRSRKSSGFIKPSPIPGVQEPDATLRTAQMPLPSHVVHPAWEWFLGGKIWTCYNCVDRHVTAGNGGQVALHYSSRITRREARYTYRQPRGEVETVAGALR